MTTNKEEGLYKINWCLSVVIIKFYTYLLKICYALVCLIGREISIPKLELQGKNKDGVKNILERVIKFSIKLCFSHWIHKNYCIIS